MDLKNKTDVELTEMLSDEMNDLCERANVMRGHVNGGQEDKVTDALFRVGATLGRVVALRDELQSRGVL